MNRDIIADLQWRYAVKKFDGSQQLPAQELHKLKQAFNLTATSYGLQPISMAVVEDKELRHELTKHSYGQQQVAQASHLLIICIQKQVDAQYIHQYFDRVRQIRGTEERILAPFQAALEQRFTEKDTEEIRQWAINQAYLALGNLLTICAVERIDACPMEGFDPKGYSQVLGLDDHNLEPVLVLPIGYRAQDDMFQDLKKVRKDLSDSVIDIASNSDNQD